MVKLLAAVSFALLASAVGGAAASPEAPLGFVGDSRSVRLAHLDPLTLVPTGPARLGVGSGGCASRRGGEACWAAPPWAWSPDHRRLVVAGNTRFAAGTIRIVDPAGLRATASFRLAGGPVGAIAWPTPDRLLAVQETCCGEKQRLLVIDSGSGRVLARRALGGSVVRLARTRAGLVLLLAPARAIGPARLAVAGRLGELRIVPLPGLVAGTRLVSPGRFELEQQLPGLAVDPVGVRAFVVGPHSTAVVDLRTLAVASHPLRRLAAAAKEDRGSIRFARWLGDGLLAVTGEDDRPAGNTTAVQPAGLELVDTRSWSTRTIDPDATAFTVAGDLLLATGTSTTGLAVYGTRGRPRFRLLGGEQAWLALAYGGRAYVGVIRRDGVQEPLRVVDLHSGRIVGTRTTPLPVPVAGGAGSWWEQ